VKFKEIFKITGIPVVFASLCCLTPIILVLLGLSTITFAASLTNVLYGDYKWAFRTAGLLLLVLSLFIYFRSKGICTINEAKRQKNKIINIILISIIAAVIGYVFFLYVVLEIIGNLLGIWGNRFNPF